MAAAAAAAAAAMMKAQIGDACGLQTDNPADADPQQLEWLQTVHGPI